MNTGLLDNQRQQADTDYGVLKEPMLQDINNARTNSAALRSQIQNKYTNSNNFMPNGMMPNANGWFNLPPGGKAGMGDYGSAKSGYENMAATGGVNRADFDPALSSYKDFMSTGGVDAASLRARGGSTIPAFYDAYKNASKRRANVQGGYSPGFDEQQAELARQSGREGFNANRQLEGDIADKVQQGRMFGTSGFGNLQSNITGMEQTGKLAGLGGLTHIGDTETGLNQFNAGQDNSMQMQLADMYQRGGIESARGLQGLYSSEPGDVGQAYRNYLAGMGGLHNNQLQNLALRGGMKGIDWAKWAQAAGTGLAAAAAF